jgi:hypothetical protein
MSRVHHSPRFDDLEARKLLTKAHIVAVHAAHAVVAAPLNLNGTLLVDNNPNATTSTTNPDGSTTVAVEVTGQLGAAGAVQGFWTETYDSMGDNAGVDVLRLHNAKGSLILEFNVANPGRAMPAGRGAVFHEYAQKLFDATGAFAGTTEGGSIELITNRAQSIIATLSLHTKGM